jgi:two-component system NtrC family response regulator
VDATDATPLEQILLGRSAAMTELRGQLRALARAPLRCLLVLGETGVGKDLVPRALCAASPHLNGRLEVYNCPAVPEDHLESELFGTTRGAYPGAVDRSGLAERADGGLLFLDEIGSMSLAHQAKVLRFLESGEGRRLGARAVYRVRTAVVAASQEGLGADVAAGRFREDLYYRLVQDALVRVPPLRERLEDVPLLARAFLSALRQPPEMDAAAAAQLCRHHWPGNVRELRAVVTSAARLCPGSRLGVEQVAAAIARIAPPAPESAPRAAPSFHAATRDLRRRMLLEALQACGGNQTRAGVLLGLHGGGEAPDLRARKRAHRVFRYWWERLVDGAGGCAS